MSLKLLEHFITYLSIKFDRRDKTQAIPTKQTKSHY